MFSRMTISAAAVLVLALGTVARAGAMDICELKKTYANATIGAKGTASLTTAAKPGWHINDNAGAPLSLKLVPRAGLTLEKPLLKRTDVAQQTKEAALAQAATCNMVREKVALAVDVTAPRRPRAPPKKVARPPSPGARGCAPRVARGSLLVISCHERLPSVPLMLISIAVPSVFGRRTTSG
jgi:hypothetical protein